MRDKIYIANACARGTYEGEEISESIHPDMNMAIRYAIKHNRDVDSDEYLVFVTEAVRLDDGDFATTAQYEKRIRDARPVYCGDLTPYYRRGLVGKYKVKVKRTLTLTIDGEEI